MDRTEDFEGLRTLDKPEQPKVCNCVNSRHLEGAVACPDCAEVEQPNQELMIVKSIQGLISAVNRELGKLGDMTFNLSDAKPLIIAKALEEIDIFEKTTLYELQKAFE